MTKDDAREIAIYTSTPALATLINNYHATCDAIADKACDGCPLHIAEHCILALSIAAMAHIQALKTQQQGAEE